ncbi:MAG: N-6 DNA methylase [Armatimonadetes bacterium]|nr:N-6 DNA methylase [Armatimonadota bacterium]
MSQNELLAPPPHNNQGLLADHYLDEVLPWRDGWLALAEESRPILAQIAGLFAAFTPSSVEAQTEQDLVRPILHLLGHTFEVQPALQVPGGLRRPDYVFYRDAPALATQKNRTLTDALPSQGGIAVGDAKHWGRTLDAATTGADAFSSKSPSWQIWFYMLHSGVEWGILTDGKRWRLYHKESAHKLDCFYEVDLEALARGGDPRRFLYFYAFFRRAAFDPGPFALAEFLRASIEYGRALGDSLEAQVYEALRHLAQGFLDYPPNGLRPEPAMLKEIYDNSLILLYRLIFILYAEARDLLPLRESEMYRETYSLHAIKHAVARDLQGGRRLLPGSGLLWPRLQELFHAINFGSPPLQVATYNGGLFDPERHPFLQRCAVGDAHLQQAIDRLARVEGHFVDYRDPSVRHIGTIYEGLLEYRLRPADDEPGWSIALENDKGDRKATGSYYTPDYIVKYIVEQAVGPALREAVFGKTTGREKIEAVLRVNVLDPAMGSGHFLVEATEFVARFLVDLGVTPEGIPAEAADLLYWKRRVAQSCIYGVDLNPLAVELAKLSLWLITVAKDRPLSFLDHHLRPGNSLLGADLAHLQRSLAPERKRRPSKADQAEAVGQISMTTIPGFAPSMGEAVRTMALIERARAETLAEVKQQETWYATLRESLVGAYGRLADLVTALDFGLAVGPAHLGELVKYVTRSNGATFPAFETILRKAGETAQQERFFHWELEFPEIFFDESGRPLGEEGGFEAVVGNPPYVRQEQLAPYKPYFARRFAEVYHGTADLFVYFFARGLRQARRGGRLSYIASNSWLRANYAGPLRQVLRTEATVERVVDLDDNHVFADAPDVYPAIEVVRKDAPSAEHIAHAAVFTRSEPLQPFAERVAEKLFPVSIHDQPDAGWQLSGSAGRSIFAKLMGAGRPLGEVVEGGMYRGVLTGCNEVFITDAATRDALVRADPSSAAILKPILRGEDLRPWYQEDEGRWLIFTRRGIDIEAYPAVRDYLAQFRERLEPRPADWPARSPWPGRKPGAYQWYEIQDTIDYYAEFERPKIVWPDIARFPRFSWDESGFCVGNTGYILVTDERWLLGYLASRCSWFLVSHTAIALGERAGANRYRLIDQYMRPLPIPDPPPPERQALADLAMAITEKARARYDLHRRTRHRIESDLGAPGRSLNQKLTAWWSLDFPTLRAEVNKAFRHDIPLAERDEWEAWLAARAAEHRSLTDGIIALEGELNERVHALFGLSREEIRVVEESTKYGYGEV